MTMTETKVRTIKTCFKRPLNLISISMDFVRTGNMHPGVIPETPPSKHRRWCVINFVFTLIIVNVRCFKTVWVYCEHGVFTSITAVQLINHTYVPILSKTHMAVKLQLICLAVIVTVYHCSRMVNVSCVLMPNIFHKKEGCIRLLSDFFDIIIQFFIQI